MSSGTIQVSKTSTSSNTLSVAMSISTQTEGASRTCQFPSPDSRAANFGVSVEAGSSLMAKKRAEFAEYMRSIAHWLDDSDEDPNYMSLEELKDICDRYYSESDES